MKEMRAALDAASEIELSDPVRFRVLTIYCLICDRWLADLAARRQPLVLLLWQFVEICNELLDIWKTMETEQLCPEMPAEAGEQPEPTESSDAVAILRRQSRDRAPSLGGPVVRTITASRMRTGSVPTLSTPEQASDLRPEAFLAVAALMLTDCCVQDRAAVVIQSIERRRRAARIVATKKKVLAQLSEAKDGQDAAAMLAAIRLADALKVRAVDDVILGKGTL